jgi:hypothetical protein
MSLLKNGYFNVRKMKLIVLLVFIISSCGKEEASTTTPTNAYRETRSITYNNITLKVVIDKPAQDEVDVLLVFHGTILYDSGILQAANNTLDNFKRILDRKDMMIVSVAYPGENMLLGDNIVHVEAALLWVKYQANQELGITVKKIFLGGHSQGGYLVTRLNTMHQTNGVIANAPGPLNLIYRCRLEEDGNLPTGVFCNNLKNTYGTPSSNPDAYHQRSLLHFTKGHKSDILFVQGLNDSPIQMHTWPIFKKDVMDCTNCQNSQFVEIVGGEHASLFASAVAKTEFNKFINSR